MPTPINIHWFRRDLRLHDNHALSLATHEKLPVLPLFIFDTEILHDLDKNDARVTFIHEQLSKINQELKNQASGLQVYFGKPLEVWKQIIAKFSVHQVFFNEDYEPYALERDKEVSKLLAEEGIQVTSVKDHVVFAPGKKDETQIEILKADGSPYTVFTPFRNKWMEHLNPEKDLANHEVKMGSFLPLSSTFLSLKAIGFTKSEIKVRYPQLEYLDNYEAVRNYPDQDATSYLSPHLRFGTISQREIMRKLKPEHKSFFNELIWREFFIQILYHFPKVVNHNFKSQYDQVQWRNNEKEFELWCKGETGYPLVDAGMRQLNQSGYMHNRVRMVVASFLTKHLLIDWRLGEAYFAKKLLDYDLAINNGNWQWAAGTGCDAAPYFRIFNPTEQRKKFDPNWEYTQKWVSYLNELSTPKPIVEHKFARERALNTYKSALNK